MSGLLDVVYLCRVGEDNVELRHSLRSLAANLPHRRVWIAGYRPSWVAGEVGHIPVPWHRDKHRSSTANLLAACRHPEVGEHFVLFNDDFFVLRPMAGVPVLNFGRVAEVAARYAGTRGTYVQGMASTARLLADLGHPDPVSYELHVPMVIHGPTMARLLDTYAGRVRGCLHKRTLYGNLAHLGGTRVPDCKVHSPGQRWDPDGAFLSTNDGAFKHGEVGAWLRARFSSPCIYEKEETFMAADPDGPVTYRNTVTGRRVERPGPDPQMDRSRRWARLDEVDAPPVTGDAVPQPAGNASTEEWRAYATAAGMDPDTAAGMTRTQLRAHFDGADAPA